MLNADKTQAIILGSPKYINSIHASDTPILTIGQSQIKFKDRVNYLGITIDSKLTWKGQVKRIISRAHGVMNSLRKSRASLASSWRKN